MNTFEELQEEACKNGVNVIEKYPFNSDRISGLYSDHTIALNKNLKNSAEKACVLAEELGHHYTTVSDIVDQSTVENRKQEMYGRAIAYNRMVGLRGIVDAYLRHCQNIYEMAEYLDVTEEFLQEALGYYASKYGVCTQVDNYVIYFEPNIGVMELV